MSSVILNPLNSAFYTNTNLEPQYVTSRTPTRAAIYLDSTSNPLELDKTNITFSSIHKIGNSQNTLAYGISRISVDSVNLTYVTPNVNATNNVIIFKSSNDPLAEFEVVLTEKFYTSTASLANEIESKLNSVSGFSGLTFTITAVTGFPGTFTITSTGGSFYFLYDLRSSAIITTSLYGFPTDQVFTTSKPLGWMGLYATKWIDVCSSDVQRYSKVKTISNGLPSNVVVRVFIDNPTFPHTLSFRDVPDISYSFLNNEPINYLSFQLRDQYGKLLYVPPISYYGFEWGINLTIEV